MVSAGRGITARCGAWGATLRTGRGAAFGVCNGAGAGVGVVAARYRAFAYSSSACIASPEMTPSA